MAMLGGGAGLAGSVSLTNFKIECRIREQNFCHHRRYLSSLLVRCLLLTREAQHRDVGRFLSAINPVSTLVFVSPGQLVLVTNNSDSVPRVHG
jgi:hypothetical protein